ncbi:Ig-like protein, group 1 [Alteromonadaceae bacterium BrNp21-10]|nr:Ig-like protein, group 1 [Alteromonadaceae bacterium BrNp21-10]
MRFLILLLWITASISGCNGVSGANGDDPFGNNTDNEESSSTTVRIGHFNQNNVFVEGVVGSSIEDSNGDVEIAAGATLGITVALVDENDQLLQSAVTVSFSSNCVVGGLASIDQQVVSVNGVATATFIDNFCATAGGTSDQISASINSDSVVVSANRDVFIHPESIGSIVFVSATPTRIGLQGTGGVDNQSVATLVFSVLGESGNPLVQQDVSFSLNTTVGGLSLSNNSGQTGTDGRVTVNVVAGTVPTSVRVTAEVVSESGAVLRTQSDLLTVSTGLADQNSFSLAADNFNPEGHNIDGSEVILTARLADSFNNPVQDGTTVSFTTEGGVIQPSCTTQNGVCSVTWTSAHPRVADRRITILATAVGHETLYDSNGNNSYDDEDGAAIYNGSDTGFNVIDGTAQTGFVDMSEAWRDDNANGVYDNVELFLDYNNNGQFDAADGLFNGPQCVDSNLCAEGSARSLHVRKAIQLFMSGSYAVLNVLDSVGTLLFSNEQDIPALSLSLARGESLEFTLRYSDTATQPLPSNTTITLATTNGSLEGKTSIIQANTYVAGASVQNYRLINDLADSESAAKATVSIVVVTPSGIESELSFEVDLQ